MKKYLQSTWMRILSCILCAISVVALAVCGFVFYLSMYHTDMTEAYKMGYQKVADNYGLYAVHMIESGQLEKLQKEFEEKGISCNVILVTSNPGENGETESTTEMVFSCGSVNADAVSEFEMDPGAYYRYSQNSLLKVLLDYTHYYGAGSNWVQYPIEMVVFDSTAGMFYYQTPVGLFEVKDIDVYTKNVFFDYRLKVVDGQKCYYNDYYQIKLDTTQYAIWDSIRIDEDRMKLAEEGEYGSKIKLITGGPISPELINTSDFVVIGSTIETNYSEYTQTYQIQVSWDKGTEAHPVAESLFTEWESLFETISRFKEIVVPFMVLSFILTLIFFGLILYSARNQREEIGVLYKLPVFTYTAVGFLIEFIILLFITEGIGWMIVNEVGSTNDILILLANLVGIMVVFALSWIQNITTRIKCRCFWRYSEVYYVIQILKWIFEKITTPIRTAMKHFRENTALFIRVILLVVAISIIEFIFICFNGYNPGGMIIGFFLEKAILIPVILYAFWQMNLLQEGSKRIATGDLHHPIDTGKMCWEFKRHGENINNVSNSIQIAVDERMKSEHFKTELITNVSHDIKTPLTSIINYVDLIKKEDIQDETVQGYVDVLDRQSARLKKLIEDLMEASKASTGNLAVSLEECDVDVLLTQVVGEFEEKLAKNQLEVVVDRPEQSIKMLVDGRHMWRVLDNLLNNACKYSMPGTRVYVSLQQKDNEAVITFKNISKSALNIPSEELLERFVRGDSSRNTEGSGLGLSIAQSLTELMRGNMTLEIDGDLFKVVLRFPVVM